MAKGAASACALVACAAGALATFLGDASAQTRHSSITQVERDRRAEDARALRLHQQATAAQAEISTLNTRFVEAGQRRAEAEAAALAAEKRLSELRGEIDAQTQNRVAARDALESALIAAAFSQRRIERSAVRAGIFASALAPAFSAEVHRSATAVDDAQRVSTEVAAQQRILVDAQQSIDAERAALVTVMARRQTAAASLTRNADAAERHARQLAAQAQTLRELASRVQRASPRGSTPGSAPAIIPTAWLAPAEGRIANAFGARGNDGIATQGALLHTRAGAQVIAPASGEVAYAGLFRSYGQVLILNLNGGYVLVLTGLEAIRARVGETVQAGEPIGEMPNSATSAPELYVEVRRSGRPIDPGRWLTSRGLVADREVRAG